MKNIIVVTGAASGMGKQFVKLLDCIGSDEIWAIDINGQNLSKLQSEVKTKIVPFVLDLTLDESFIAYHDMLETEKPNVLWLCNCSGFGKFGRYDEICIQQTSKMIDLNCKAYVKMTELSLPFMHKGSKLVNIASMAGFQPVPYLSTYGATKAFTISYTRAIRQEVMPKGITVTCVCPYWTKTNFFNVAERADAKNKVITKFPVMYNPEDVVAKAIKDAIKGKEMSIYGAYSRAQARVVKFLPHKFVMWKWRKQQNFDNKYHVKDELKKLK